jgi:hypothetical protein
VKEIYRAAALVSDTFLIAYLQANNEEEVQQFIFQFTHLSAHKNNFLMITATNVTAATAPIS